MLEVTRRHFLSKLTTGIGGAALASLLPQPLRGAASAAVEPLLAHHAPKAKRII